MGIPFSGRWCRRLRLANGVAAYDILSSDSERFTLHAFLILVFGDIPAIAMVMRMKGHNGYSPCRMCKITGLPLPDSNGTTLYVPLDRSSHPDVVNKPLATKRYDPHNLPLRTHEEFIQMANEVDDSITNAAADRLSREYGIKGVPILSHLDSLRFPLSFPYDFMHLIWENLLKNLILHWTGLYKGLDDGKESYQLSKAVWKSIGEYSARSGSTTPSAYGVRVPNIAADGVSISAEMWSFWALYIGPVLLRRQFTEQTYYNHFIRLVYLLNICLQFEITKDEIAELRQGFIKWVEDYEE
jgi:hypothetical protein